MSNQFEKELIKTMLKELNIDKQCLEKMASEPNTVFKVRDKPSPLVFFEPDTATALLSLDLWSCAVIGMAGRLPIGISVGIASHHSIDIMAQGVAQSPVVIVSPLPIKGGFFARKENATVGISFIDDDKVMPDFSNLSSEKIKQLQSILDSVDEVMARLNGPSYYRGGGMTMEVKRHYDLDPIPEIKKTPSVKELQRQNKSRYAKDYTSVHRRK